MDETPHQRNETPPPRPFDADLRVLAVGEESTEWLGCLLATARADLAPRDFAERHLADEMAINKWRLLRVWLMEKAVYQHEALDFEPVAEQAEDGTPVEPHEDVYYLALSHTPERHAIVLAALSRLEARFHRQFCAALRLFIAWRRLHPLPPASETPNHNERKENPTCEPSPSAPSLPMM